MRKRRYTKAADWLPVLEEWKQSGLSKKAFCEQRAINGKHFYRWYSKLRKLEFSHVALSEKTPVISRDFIPVEITHPAKATANPTVCVLHLSARLQLHVPLSGIDYNFLRTLFEAAEVKPC